MNLLPIRKQNRTPFGDVLDIQREMNRLFDFSLGHWSDPWGSEEGSWQPALDIRESKDAITVHADLPGVRKEDVDVTVREGILEIRGERKHENQTKEDGLVRTERVHGQFYRAVQLPAAVDRSAIKATYKNGVLELTLPKSEEAKPKQIKIDVV